jgi:single-strand DNA-binding protein
MAGVNKVILLGNLGSDPEVRALPSGVKVANINIATSEAYTGKDGQRVEQTEWHRVELWDNLATIAEQYLKGNQVYIEGKICSEEWQDKSGVTIRGYRIRATSMNLIGGRNERPSGDAPRLVQNQNRFVRKSRGSQGPSISSFNDRRRRPSILNFMTKGI